jgi:oxaloacetate decarboxylase alpha subunit/pyruvate carboxylase subunit B
VTPTSQIVGTQAMMNVKFGRWKMICQPAQDIALGKYGRTPGPVDPAILAMAENLSNSKAVTGRPADFLAPGLENYRKQCVGKGLPADDETAVLFAMFPLQVEALINGASAAQPAPPPAPAPPAPAPPAPAPPAPAPPTSAPPAPVLSDNHSARKMILTIDGQRHQVCVQKMAG